MLLFEIMGFLYLKRSMYIMILTDNDLERLDLLVDAISHVGLDALHCLENDRPTVYYTSCMVEMRILRRRYKKLERFLREKGYSLTQTHLSHVYRLTKNKD